MKFLSRIAVVGLVIVPAGCAMFSAWKSIPPPGGCDQCHTLPISANWQVMYQPANVESERGQLYFQTPQYNLPLKGKQQSPLDTKKMEELACFECHKEPSAAHRKFTGRFHH
ncbi:MAG TPA: cytochrome C [Desulfuromonadaceae bacterium]